MKGGNNPVIAEAMSIIKVVNKVIELSFHYMHFETDNASIVKAIKDHNRPRTNWRVVCNQIM